MPPPPTESAILTSFLLNPAPLPEIISFQKFVELFPKSLQSNPQIKTLYRELQHQRNTDIDMVTENIAREVRRGERQKTELRQTWLQQQRQNGASSIDAVDKMDVEIDGQLFGQAANLTASQPHTLKTLVLAMERACEGLESEVEAIEKQRLAMLDEMKTIVGELSDLRYGKFNKPVGGAETVAEEVTGALRTLEDVCRSSTTT